MKNVITQISRVLVGVLFIISGLIKLNDPVGFGYKLEEYFSEEVLNLPFLTPLALPIAVFVVIFEVVLGVMLLFGFKRKFTIWSLLLMIVFFTFLTFYSAFFNKVTDCGCFGDALKLTPWQSFYKDLALLVLIAILFVNQKLIRPFLSKGLTNAVVAVSFALCCFMGYWVLNHLPIKDFRAYKVGNNIEKGMEFPQGAEKSKVEMVFVYEVKGQKKEFGENDLMNLPADAKFVERVDKVISQGYVPPIHDFSMELDGSDYKDELLKEPKLLVFVAYDLKKSSEEGMSALEGIAKKAKSKGYKVIMMTAGLEDEIANSKKKYGHTFDYYFCDATTLKTIERANPSLVIIQNGTIAQKLHWKDADALKLD
ncbi:BT_3928 family protein [Flavobacterium sp.]|uniref:BT_3928 family protein n=1 Tax=Flavobacterium sp. TaxID=239 RepID=UPI0012110D5E|nr:BT_3928 family protein [Flavobacterium sp.]RZJ70461.1 MAG: DoxX family protein [Flavobacterium sp.]